MISKAESEAQELITEHDDLVHCKSYLSAPLYKYHFASQCFDIDSIVDDMDSKFFKVLFFQSTVCILYSLQSKAIRMGSVLETTTFSSQSATVLVASLLLCVVFFDFSRFLLSLYVFLLVSFYFFHACSSVYFTFSTTAMSQGTNN